MHDVAIVDYGMGNLFSVRQAFRHVGLQGIITSSTSDLLRAKAVVIPGVGAFGDAMAALERLDLVAPLKDVAESDTLLFGICLGMELLMSESYEFGHHKGLGVVPGSVVRLAPVTQSARRPKVPHVGWSQIVPPKKQDAQEAWKQTPLESTTAGEYMYFVHSYYVNLQDEEVVLSTSEYGGIEFCSSFMSGNIFACQFHPERSGRQGLQIYETLASRIRS